MGNSYTGTNNLPAMLTALAASAGDALVVDSHSPGGYTFEGHSTNSTSLNKIAQGNWDFVVLQEQSQLPAFADAYVQANVYPYAQNLTAAVRTSNECAELVFYTTWGRENGDAQNCGVWPAVCTYAGMDDLLQLRYRNMAQQNDGVLSPVAAVWRYLRENNPEIQLYSSDGSHPSVAGTYAAACTFYSVLFRKNPLLITDNSSLAPEVASSIRQATQTVVFDDFTQWFVGKYDAAANFTYQVDANSVQFENTSAFATDYSWDFGDGNTSILPNPLHNYVAAGTYTVTLSAVKCGQLSTSNYQVTVGALGVSTSSVNAIKHYPNPATDLLYVDAINFENIKMFDVSGKEIKVAFFENADATVIDCSKILAGIYIIAFEKEGIYQKIKVSIR